MSDFDRSSVKEQLILAGRRLDALGLVPARDGNLSARASQTTLFVTRTMVRKRELNEGDIVEVDVQGRPVHDREPRPSSELGMHLAVYKHRPETQCVIHAHPPAAVGFACTGRGLTEPLMPEAVVALGPVPLAPYATPGTPEVEASIREPLKTHNAILLANHGAITLGDSVEQALDRMETLEHVARVALVAHVLGGVQPLSSDSMKALKSLHKPGSA